MLVLKNLCKEYREDGTVNKALQAVNIEFKDHEFVSVIGPSGSGKTTLLHIIGGMDVFSDGDMRRRFTATNPRMQGSWRSAILRKERRGSWWQRISRPEESILKNYPM